jgi:hypothetical protein
MRINQMKHFITLANSKQVSIPEYVRSIRAIIAADPDIKYPHGLTTWWPTTGADIRSQFRASIHDRINTRAGEAWRSTMTDREHNERLDCYDIRAHCQTRVIIRRLRTPRLNRRFAHLLYTDED